MNSNTIVAIRNLPSVNVPGANGVALGAITIPSGVFLDGVPFKIRASGSLIVGLTGGGGTVGVSITNTAGTTFSLAVATNGSITGPTNFILECVSIWDSTSQLINGVSGYAFYDGTRTAFTTQQNQVSGATDMGGRIVRCSTNFNFTTVFDNFATLKELVVEYV